MSPVKAKMMPQSPSSLQTYVNCPYQYMAKYITKEVKFTQNAAAAFGEKMHRDIEYFLTARADLPQYAAPMKPLLESLRAALVGAEVKLAVAETGAAVPFSSKDAYQRCIVDAIASSKDRKHIICVDWKTGKKRDAQIQHDFLKKCALAAFPEAETVTTNFVYLYQGKSDSQTHKRGQPLTLLDTHMNEIKIAHAYQAFPPTPNGLCKNWCDVISCRFNGKGR